jgi:hypothetical protein
VHNISLIERPAIPIEHSPIAKRLAPLPGNLVAPRGDEVLNAASGARGLASNALLPR